jgi:hypothetical protein
LSARTNRWVVAAAIAALILGAMLSRAIEPGVRVQKVTLAEGSLSRIGNNFFLQKKYGTQVTFIKDDKGEVMAISRHKPGRPDSAGKKLKTK